LRSGGGVGEGGRGCARVGEGADITPDLLSLPFPSLSETYVFEK
jgi:hypothetical protein